MLTFIITLNGIKQGGLQSLVTFPSKLTVYLQKIANAKVERFIVDQSAGARAYTDHIVLKSPCAYGMRKML
jgi:hypothetical protein